MGQAAVLLVNLETRQIVYANAVAREMSPDAGLPTSLDAWSDSAELRDIDGDELSDTRHPLSLVAQSLPVDGQGVSAARSSAIGRKREPLWVVALPLVDAPQLEGYALVLFLPISERQHARSAAKAAHTQSELQSRAVLATGMSFTMADAQSEDMPLIWVNPAFTTTTGYSFDEAVGKNCRFLQGPATDPDAHVEIRRLINARESVNLTILNYRKDGSAFWNQLSMSPIFDAEGVLTHYVGIQTDVTAKVASDRERDLALAEAQEARREAELAQQQLRLLAEATSQLAATLDVTESLQRLATLTVPLLADWVIVATANEDSILDAIVVRHKDRSAADTDAYAQQLIASSTSDSILQHLLNGGEARVVNDYSSDAQREARSKWVHDNDTLKMADNFGAESVMFVPLPGRDRVDGVMVLVRSKGSDPYNDQDFGVAVDLGRRAGLTLDNARLYQQEHSIAETLQMSLLPVIPSVPGTPAAARYLAGGNSAAVGGDFYELIPFNNGRIGFAIGDVVGHDVFAAAAMGHLRGLMRASAWNRQLENEVEGEEPDPAQVLSRVDELLIGLHIETLATALYAYLEPPKNDLRVLRYSNAGHLPLLVRKPDGTVSILESAPEMMLGIGISDRKCQEETLPVGSLILTYTDGLVERRGENLTDGLQRLAEMFSNAPTDPDAACGYLIKQLEGSVSHEVATMSDDVAVMIVQA